MFEGLSVDDAYQLALDYLYGLINFEQKRHDRYMASKIDPARPERLMAHFGSPHLKFPAIHIAGTKGKGSVAAMCAACLRASGLRVGLYTSPHVTEFRERIRILTPADAEGQITKEQFTALMAKMSPVVEQIPGITWFEVVTAIAFLHFATEEVDVAVVEVGLGGRLDATNVLTPLVSVITSLSFDHTEFLGNTLVEIAGEKGGIIKPGVPVVTAPQPVEAMERILELAQENKSPIIIVGQDWTYKGERQNGESWEQKLIVHRSADSGFVPTGSSFRLALAGAHQLENATVALAALNQVRSQFPGLTFEAVSAGLESVQWIGRLQIVHRVSGEPMVIVDCAHNPDSSAKLRHALMHDFEYERLWIVLGATKGKNLSGIMGQLLPIAEAIVVTVSTHPRAVEPDELAQVAFDLGYEVVSSSGVSDAMIAAWELASPKDLICVTGSIFVVGDLLNEWESLQSRLCRDAVKS